MSDSQPRNETPGAEGTDRASARGSGKRRKGRHPEATPEDDQLLRPRFLAPQHWPFWAGMGLLRAVTALPHGARMAVGRTLGRLFWVFGRDRRKVALRNLELCFPELSKGERRRIARENFASLGCGVIEIGMAWWTPDDELDELVEVEGEEHLREAMAGGDGLLLLTCHMTCQELGGRIVSRLAPLHVLYREDNNPVVATFVRRCRRSHAKDVIANSDMRGMVRALRGGELIWYAPDQNVRPRRGGIFAPFFGIEASTTPAAARLAERTGCRVLPYYPVRTERGYRLVFEPVLEDFPGGDSLEEATARMNATLERWIRAHPEHYFWVHKRFKTRPEGEPEIYP